MCTCETCRAIYGGDGPYRPTGSRTVWLGGLELGDELWASFRIPIGLAFFFRSSTAGGVVAFYPSPAGTTECELELGTWNELVAANPILAGLETDAEALIVNRLDEARQYAIVPIDDCYRLVGLVKVRWEGISGGVHMGRCRGRVLRRDRAAGGMTDVQVAASPGTQAAPGLELEVTGARASMSHAAPTLVFALRAAEPTGRRDLHRRALDPDPHRPRAALARRRDPRAARRPLRRRRSAGRRRRPASCGREVDRARAVASLIGPTSSCPCRAATTSRWRRPSTSTRCPDGDVPLSFHFSGRIFYRGDDGRLQVVLAPWSSATFRLPVTTWKKMIDWHYPGSGWIRVRRRDARAPAAAQGRPGAAHLRRDGRRDARRRRPARDRRARRVPALRGLRAVPLHARVDQERDPDAVRHRLPRRLRAWLRLPAAAVPAAR